MTETFHRSQLDNGLRVLVAPDHSVPAVAVAVVYDVGYRSEPEGREGFAHLFEHLMFQGSRNLKPLEHARYVNGCGGGFNGLTHRDHTTFFEVLPSAGLELALFLEADRMRAPRLTEESLATQLAVVDQEIRRKVFDNPYGGLPSPYLPAVMFDDFANAHNGWGAAERLKTVTVDECRSFFEDYYTPANALLVICGDAEPGLVDELVERHFGDVPRGAAAPSRAASAVISYGQQPRHHEHRHPAAAVPAMSAGWILPDPVREAAEYRAAVLLAEILANGPESALQSRLIRGDKSVSQLGMTSGAGAAHFDGRDPNTLALTMFLRPQSDPNAILDAVYKEMSALADHRPAPEQLARYAARWATSWARGLDPLGARVQHLGAFELLLGGAEAALELPAQIRRITTLEVTAAAKALADQPRRFVTVLPETAQHAVEAQR